ncbi:receptor-like protein kinase precursor [Seminavis robusta]|uniref:Receptor-like protein kinase n=1 Tax=Seminavis robusta TaxID=568900 RepID=A0A9N8E8P3_9STRA|nr:receptor-like protein kinase precursor [Seminavis robusta]|eukprot:Sro794_g203460.1 receptor-like protein kinase precursor (706) ;mRNA; r:43835-46071
MDPSSQNAADAKLVQDITARRPDLEAAHQQYQHPRGRRPRGPSPQRPSPQRRVVHHNNNSIPRSRAAAAAPDPEESSDTEPDVERADENTIVTTEGEPASSPWPQLQNGNARQQQAAPGAFRESVGQQSQQVSPLNLKGGAANVLGRPTPTQLDTIQDTNNYLENNATVEAATHNSHEDEDMAQQQKRKRLYWAMAGGIGMLLLIAAIIGIAIGVASSKEPSSQTQVDTTNAPEEITTALVKEFFPTGLPNRSQEAVLSNNDRLPQVRAFQWLSQDENWQKYSVPQRRQRFALATLYYATNGPQWFDHLLPDERANVTPWLDYSVHECSWFAMLKGYGRPKCENYTDHNITLANPWDAHFDYTSILLSADPSLLPPDTHHVPARLRGTLVPELALLTSLQELDMDYQSIKGTIPNELTQLSNTLEYIDLIKCFFTGTIPAGLFVSSKSLFLSRNARLLASIPTAIGNSSKLEYLLLTETNLEGSIPSEIGMATNLLELFLNANDLEGTIPSEVGLLSLLHVLDLTYNELSGSIPSEIGQAQSLQRLKLGLKSGMRGTLPTSLALLSNLQELDLYKNSLEGSLQPELFYLRTNSSTEVSMTPSWPNLTTLILTDNRLSGSLPSEIGLLGALERLFLARNKLESQLPTELGSLSNLECLGIAQNQFTGELPFEVSNGLPGLVTDVESFALSSSTPLLSLNFSARCPH